MKPFNLLLKYTLCENKVYRRIFRLIRRLLIKFINPDVTGEYFGVMVRFPLRHDLVINTDDHKLFNTPLSRLSMEIRNHFGVLNMVDVGANIGDSIILAQPTEGDHFWAIEGSASYLPYLKYNLRNIRSLELISCYLSDTDEKIYGSEVLENATARVSSGGDNLLEFKRLDSLFKIGQGKQPNLLKIDIEGHEPRVLAGGRNFFKYIHPLVHMEVHVCLLLSEGFSADASVAIMRDFGYEFVLIYDNLGYYLGSYSITDQALFNLLEYARQRSFYYYDVTFYSTAHSGFMGPFGSSEKLFYDNLKSGLY